MDSFHGIRILENPNLPPNVAYFVNQGRIGPVLYRGRLVSDFILRCAAVASNGRRLPRRLKKRLTRELRRTKTEET